MPVTIHHAIVFMVVFIIVVSMMTATVYVAIIGALVDTYRYEKAIERANEKVAIAAVNGHEGLYYGVRNLGVTPTTIRELGVIDATGARRVIRANIVLEPGEVIVERTTGSRGVIYAITGRGNVFTAQILDVVTISERMRFSLRDLRPAYVQTTAPVSYEGTYIETTGVGVYGYIFGYVIVDDPHSDASVFIPIGPIGINTLFQNENIPYQYQRTVRTTVLRVSVDYLFEIDNDPNVNAGQPFYRIRMGLDVDRLDNRQGLLLHGCVGYAWRILPSNMYGVQIDPVGSRACDTNTRGAHIYRICERIDTFIAASVLNMRALLSFLSNPETRSLPTEAPSGSQAFIILSRCFYIEDSQLQSFTTSLERPWTYIDGFPIYTYIVFPGRNDHYGRAVTINSILINLVFDPEIIVRSLLERI